MGILFSLRNFRKLSSGQQFPQVNFDFNSKSNIIQVLSKTTDGVKGIYVTGKERTGEARLIV